MDTEQSEMTLFKKFLVRFNKRRSVLMCFKIKVNSLEHLQNHASVFSHECVLSIKMFVICDYKN